MKATFSPGDPLSPLQAEQLRKVILLLGGGGHKLQYLFSQHLNPLAELDMAVADAFVCKLSPQLPTAKPV